MKTKKRYDVIGEQIDNELKSISILEKISLVAIGFISGILFQYFNIYKWLFVVENCSGEFICPPASLCNFACFPRIFPISTIFMIVSIFIGVWYLFKQD